MDEGWTTEKWGERGELYRGGGDLTFLNLINTRLNHPIWRVIVQYSHGKWHSSALMLSFSEEISRLVFTF